MSKKEKNKLEAKILYLENKREEMLDNACLTLADILDRRIYQLKLILED